jgi:micrococcal nuclease
MRRIALFVVPALLALAGCGDASSPSSRESVSGTRVVQVADGDTITVELDGERERVRVIGINAPEQGECLADEATELLRDLVDGEEVELIADRSDRDRFGRLLRYVEVDGTDAGAELVRAGVALARRYPPDTARSDGYATLQLRAADAGRGMWAAGACGEAVAGAEVVISEIRFDADGDDNQNLNDEWVRITNRGDAPVDLTGWVLKDTSATHRYRFPDGFVLDAGGSVTVRTGCGTDSGADLHWCSQGSAVWNNSGDTAFLLDPSGNIVDSVDD